jgi:ABC-type amino acid transport substrate-binding protein
MTMQLLQQRNVALGLWVTALAALLLSIYAAFLDNSGPGPDPAAAADQPGLVRSLDEHRVLRVGYGGFPPYTMEDPRTRQVSGVAVDIMNEIGRQLGVSVEWHRFNWNTMKADLDRGQFDVLADAIFQTPARGRELTFTEPYAYFAIGIGVVRAGNNRFQTIDRLNDPAVRVAVGQGFAEETFIRARAPRANILSIPSNEDTGAPVNAVLTGRADIAIVNLENAQRFVKSNPRNLRILWENDPQAFVPAGFALRFGDLTGAEFLNVSLRNLQTTGVLKVIAEKHSATDNFRPMPQP